MSKPIAIVAGEPNSIASEIIFKSWKNRKKYSHKTFFIIGSFDLINLQKKKLKYNIKTKKINNDFNKKELKGDFIPILDVKYKQDKPFQKISTRSNAYIFNCFNQAITLINKKKILGFINCPVNKETLFKKDYQGVTEFLSKKCKAKGKEVMLIYNKKLAVSPVTTHISLREIKNKLNKSDIMKKIKTINSFYKKKLKKVPNIVVLGLNPHNFSSGKLSEERKIILPAVKKLKKLGIKIKGPISPDTSFMFFEKNKINVIVGMYHDQVLTPFKTLFKYNAINITLGLPFVRISPDHGVATNIIGKKIANPKSLIESIKFFNYLF